MQGQGLKTVWCVFSIENNYDQPLNNLVMIFSVKPELTDFCEFLGVKLEGCELPLIEAIIKAFKGEVHALSGGFHGNKFVWDKGGDGASYRLQKIECDTRLEETM